MFEQAPPNLPMSKEPEDILEKVSPVVPTPARSNPTSPPVLPKETMVIETPHHGMKRLIFVFGVILGLVVIGGVSWFFIRKSLNQTTTEVVQPTPQPAAETPTTPPPPPPEFITPPPTEPPPPTTPVDTDGDGLSDETEAQIGTNPNLIDSDNDGLTDFEEVNIYKTNPNNPDTDGDKYLDGEEVRNGYNPNGPGKLLTQP